MKIAKLTKLFTVAAAILASAPVLAPAQEINQSGSGGFTVKPSRTKASRANDPLVGSFEYKHDDGTRESSLSLSGSGELVWIHQYQTVGNNRQIVSISTSWEDVANGRSARMFVWRDPNQDGNPTDAVLLRQQTITVQNTNTGIINEYVLDSPVDVSGRFFIGVAVQQLPGELPCPVDTSSVYVAGRTWFVGDFQTFNPNNLAANDVPPTDASDVGAGYAILRANADPPTDITYQGNIRQNGAPLNGNADLQFSLFDAETAGTQIGSTATVANVAVADGIFTVPLPFGAAEFNGPARWLEISVASPPGGAFVLLSPRQRIGAAPYAMHARSVPWGDIQNMPPGFADNIDDVGTGDVTGVTAGPGLTGGGTTGTLTLSANFGGTGVATSLARSDHFHNSLDASDGSPADVVFADTAGNVGVGTTTPARRLHVENGVSGATSISTSDFVIEDDAAAFQHFITPDDVESGLLFGDVGASIGGGIIFNTLGTNNGMLFRTGGNSTRMTLDGAGRLGIGVGTPTATLHVGGVSGNGSVILPNSAIDSVEIFDEPGVASDSEGVLAEALTTSAQPLLSRSIDVPTAGYVIVIGSAQATANHVTGTQSSATFGVSTSATIFPSSQDVQVSLPAAAATGGYNWAVAVHHVFTVAAGTQTFHLLAQESFAQWSASEMHLTLLFVPTDYGIVSATAATADQRDKQDKTPELTRIVTGAVQAKPVENVQGEINRLRAIVEQQRLLLDNLKNAICKASPVPEVCK